MEPNVLSLVSLLGKVCDDYVVGMNLRCGRQVGARQIFAKKISFLPLIFSLFILLLSL